ncbi:Gamma-aminobutyric acid (GABA) B receptor [Seminavis robusta]|uniref:Gamma-aminobutyric acid (GABA) B receptor n=1 Tax=Seminavis robusta TaxID=568900 RepID=A0A9N8HJI4_9STRA|nr:Gamma-aminobutyric acid (GABA) B receptor [Seminavis robusta]|eukprot:Sro768_g199680.1 Gamma-aminobutyric acid (GABA) B receptor (853) ;mRNA; r:35473-38031
MASVSNSSDAVDGSITNGDSDRGGYPWTRAGSSVVQLDENTRFGHLLGLHTLSTTEVINGEVERSIINVFYTGTAAAFLAWKHFEERRGDILPNLPSLLDGCDFHMSYQLHDNRWSGLEAATNLLGALEDDNNRENASPVGDPFAFFGDYWSSVSKPLAILGGAFQIPQMTLANAVELGDFPFLSSTTASVARDAEAAILFFRDLGVKDLAGIFINDSWGNSFHAFMRKFALDHGIRLTSFSYDKNNIERSIIDLKESKRRHVIAVMHDWRQVLRIAHQHGIVGNPEYFWLASETKSWTHDTFRLDKETDADLAHALHGIATINPYVDPNPAFEQAMSDLRNDPTVQQEYLSTMAEPELFDGFDFSVYEPSPFLYSTFDAILTMGIAACNTPHPLFNASELFQTITQTSFMGLSGNITLDPITGVRISETVDFGIEYILLSEEKSDDQSFRFDSRLATVVVGHQLEHRAPMVFNDNTTILPPAIPPVEGVNLNLIPPAALVVGYIMAAVAISTSFGFCTWTVYNRATPFVRVSQPFFLFQLCLGTFLMALAIIPLSLPGSSPEQGPNRGLDAACMSVIWLVALGFVISMSALLSKTWRLIKLYQSGSRLRRINIKIKDVMLPFVVLMVINVTLLLCITLVTPFTYQRVDMENYDQFGRNLESYGTCNYFRPTDTRVWAFVIPLWLVDSIAIFIGMYQCYRTRNLAREISESYYLTLIMGSIIETLCLGVPMLVVASDNPTASFLVGSFLLCASCLTVLLPIFIPKFYARKRNAQSVMNLMRQTSQQRSSWGRSDMTLTAEQMRTGITPVFRPSLDPSSANGVLRNVSGLDLTSHVDHSGGFMNASIQSHSVR